jgi:HEAT repeat protein
VRDDEIRGAGTFLILVALLGSASAAATRAPVSEADWRVTSGYCLPDVRFEGDTRYEIIREATRFPEKPDMKTPLADYDPGFWLRRALSPAWLPADWGRHLTRAPKWAGVVWWKRGELKLDALLLRFKAGGLMMHVTDTRSDLVVVVRSVDGPLIQGALDEALPSLCGRFLAAPIAKEWRIRYHPTRGRPDHVHGFLLAPADSWGPLLPPTYSQCAFVVSRSFAVFAFSKAYPGPEPGAGVSAPLFGKDIPPAPAVARLSEYLGEEPWKANTFAERLAAVRAQLPEDIGDLQARVSAGDQRIRAALEALSAARQALTQKLGALRRQTVDSPGAYDLILLGLTLPDGAFGEPASMRDFRRMAMEAAANLGEERVAPLLAQLAASSSDEAVARSAIQTLGAMLGPEALGSLGPLVENADMEDPAARAHARDALASLSNNPDASLLAPVEELARTSPYPEIRSAAVGYAAELARRTGDEAVRERARAVARESLQDADPGVRRLAVVRAKRIADPAAVPLLVKLAEGGDQASRFDAALAIAAAKGWRVDANSGSTDEEKEAAVQAVFARVAEDEAP